MRGLATARRYLALVLVSVIGLVLSGSMFLLVRQWKDEKFAMSLTSLVDERVGAIRDDLEGALENPAYLRPFYVTTSLELRADVQQFLAEIFIQDEEIEMIGWAPHIPEQERDTVEVWGQATVDPGFQILEATTQGEYVPALRRPEYFPLVHIATSGPSPVTHGLDLTTHPTFREALRQAHTSGEPIITPRSHLLPDDAKISRVFVVQPVYRPTVSLSAPSPPVLAGVIVIGVRLDRLIQDALGDLHTAGLEILLEDLTTPAEPGLLYFHPPRQQPQREVKGAEPPHLPALQRQEFTIGGRQWAITPRPTPALLAERDYIQSWIVLVVGGLCTGLVVSLLGFMLQRTTQVERLVEERTTSLQKANVQLQQEIAERQRTGRALQQAKEAAETASRAKADFLATMSHEIRTPMNAILGMVDLLRETTLTPNQHDYVERCSKAGEHLLGLINAVLDLSKIEAGHLELEHVPFDLEDLLHTVGDLMGGRAAAKALELLSRVAPDVPTHLIGDPSRLRQILINLVGNAIKFTETGDVVLDVEQDPTAHTRGTLRFSVRDTGIGIPAEKLEAVFESFTQVDVSTTRKYGGTGLGLSISQRLVHLMGGQLGVDSQVGAGSTFFFTVPCEIDPAPPPRSAAFSPQLHGLRVLVIDDNATNLLIVREILGRYGACVTEVGGAEEGLVVWATAQQAQQPFHVVLVDCQMPDKDGFYFVEQLTQRHQSDASAILMLSSDNRPGDRARCQTLGVAQYLLKPIARPALCRAIAAAVHQRDSAPEPQTPAIAPPAVAHDRPLNILVAEDNEDNQMLIRAYLKQTSHQLTIADNGLVAVERFKAAPYDLVLMDVQMPVMDGYSATASIRQWEQEQHRPPACIIALTANSLAEDRQKSLQAGCDGHLTKPIRKATLLAAITEYADSTTPP